MDPANEKKYHFTLADAQKRAQANGGRLFDGYTFFITPKVQGEVEISLLKAVIKACGGTVRVYIFSLHVKFYLMYSQVSSANITPRNLAAGEKRLVVSCEADKKIWKPLVEQGHSVFSKEFVLTSALVQKMDLQNDELQVKGST
jgi:hypothetical protein